MFCCFDSVFCEQRDEMWKVVFIVFSSVFAVGVGAQMVGGFSTIDISDEGAQNALNYAVAQHNKLTNDMYLSQVTDVVKVLRQVGNV